MPQIAFFFTMCNFLLHSSHYSVALNLIFTVYTFCPTVPNFLSSLPQMEPTPSKVRNHYSQKHQEAHFERALALKKATNVDCPSHVYHPNICHRALCCGWLISLISSLTQDDDTDLEISDDESENPRVSTLSFYIEEDDLDHQQEILRLFQALRDKSFPTMIVSLPKKQCHVNTVITHPPLPISRNPPRAMAPPLLKWQKSTLLNKISESVGAPSTQALPLHKSTGDLNVP